MGSILTPRPSILVLSPRRRAIFVIFAVLRKVHNHDQKSIQNWTKHGPKINEKSTKQSIKCPCPFWIETCTQNGTKMVPNGHPEFPGKSRKPPLERPRNGTTPQVAPKTTQGPILDPYWTPKVPLGSPKRRTQDPQSTPKAPPKDPQSSPKGPLNSPKASPKEPQRIPIKTLQIGSLLHDFLDDD